jgi:hypothetical protein
LHRSRGGVFGLHVSVTFRSRCPVLRSSPSRVLATAALCTAVLASCHDSSSGPEPLGPPASLQVVAGDGQRGEVGKELANPLVVKVTDKKGHALRDQIVNFVVTSGHGSVFAGANITNEKGIAQERWTLGTSTAEDQTVEVRAVDNKTGAPLVFATFTATPLPGPAAALTKVSGDEQRDVVATTLANPLVVRVADRYDNPIPGLAVSWAPGAPGQGVLTSAGPTDATGKGNAQWTLGTTAGPQSATASVPGVTAVTFNAVARAGPGALLAIVSGDNQTGTTTAWLPQPLRVRVTDAYGNGVGGGSVNWEVLTGTGTLRPTHQSCIPHPISCTLYYDTLIDSNGYTQQDFSPGLGSNTIRASVGNATEAPWAVVFTETGTP